MRVNLIEKIIFTFAKVNVPTQPVTFKICGAKSNSSDDRYMNYLSWLQKNPYS